MPWGEVAAEVCAPACAAPGSVKACFGHSEGAAGVHGALLAILAIQERGAPPVMHVRALSAYVAHALADWRAACALTALVPRVCSLSPACSQGHAPLMAPTMAAHKRALILAGRQALGLLAAFTLLSRANAYVQACALSTLVPLVVFSR